MDTPKPRRSPIQHLWLFLTGIAMGTADVIPGVSGGTMAFILGIYEELLDAIKSFNLDAIKLLFQGKIGALLGHVPWRFLLVLFAGIATAVLSLAVVVSWLLDNQPVYLFAFFFGLILASILAIGAKLRWSPTVGIALVVGTAIAYLIVGLVPLDMPHDPLTLFLSGYVAIMAMILPGISGSFILLLLGQYDYVLGAVRDLDLLTIAIVGTGAAIGIISFARILSWLLNHFEQLTLAVLVGFMVGSLRKIWPWKEVLATRIDRHGEVIPLIERNVLPFSVNQFLIALALCVVGFVVVSVLDHLQSGANPLFRLFGRTRQETPLVPVE